MLIISSSELDSFQSCLCIFRDFSWSPSDNYLAYWVPEDNDIPARVTIISMPSRNEMCIRNLFNVADCRMHWQKNGDFLCVKVDRYSKAKKAEDTGQWKYSVCIVFYLENCVVIIWNYIELILL